MRALSPLPPSSTVDQQKQARNGELVLVPPCVAASMDQPPPGATWSTGLEISRLRSVRLAVGLGWTPASHAEFAASEFAAAFHRFPVLTGSQPVATSYHELSHSVQNEKLINLASERTGHNH
jgi:hypothetical protein